MIELNLFTKFRLFFFAFFIANCSLLILQVVHAVQLPSGAIQHVTLSSPLPNQYGGQQVEAFKVMQVLRPPGNKFTLVIT